MKTDHFFRNSHGYAFLRSYVRLAHSLFYEEISVEGTGHLPAKGPVIFTPNHNNALMDALAVICHVDSQPVFMAKAEVFKPGIVSRLLSFLKIVPVYRMGDGMENIQQNDGSFDVVLQALLNGQSIGIMPEGTHSEMLRLRPLKKGFARLALKALEMDGTGERIQIVPVGIHYSNYLKFRAKLAVVFGPPIDASDFLSLYRENSQKGIQALREKLEEELKKIMIHNDNDEYYHLINDLAEMAAPEIQREMDLPDNYFGRFLATKIITDKLCQGNADLEEIDKLMNEFRETSKRLKINPKAFEGLYPQSHLGWDLVRYISGFPFFVSGFLYHIVPGLITRFISGTVEDPRFRSSFRFALMALLFPLYYLLMLLFLPEPFITRILLTVAMPVFGILAYDYFRGLQVFISSIRLNYRTRNNDPSFSRLNYVRRQIVKKTRDRVL